MPKTTKPKPTLNKTDLSTIENLMIKTITSLVPIMIDEKLNPLKEQISHLPTKEEYYTREDDTMVELKAIREDQAIITQNNQDQFDRLDNLEFLHTLPHPHFSKP